MASVMTTCMTPAGAVPTPHASPECSAAEPQTLYGFVVVIRKDGSDGARFPMCEEQVTFGRAESSDIRVNRASVAPDVHARLFVTEDNRVYLEIPQPAVFHVSKLGVMQTQQQVRIVPGDTWELGGRAFRFDSAVAAVSTPGKKKGTTPRRTPLASVENGALTPRALMPQSAKSSRSRKSLAPRTPRVYEVPTKTGMTPDAAEALQPRARSRSRSASVGRRRRSMATPDMLRGCSSSGTSTSAAAARRRSMPAMQPVSMASSVFDMDDIPACLPSPLKVGDQSARCRSASPDRAVITQAASAARRRGSRSKSMPVRAVEEVQEDPESKMLHEAASAPTRRRRGSRSKSMPVRDAADVNDGEEDHEDAASSDNESNQLSDAAIAGPRRRRASRSKSMPVREISRIVPMLQDEDGPVAVAVDDEVQCTRRNSMSLRRSSSEAVALDRLPREESNADVNALIGVALYSSSADLARDQNASLCLDRLLATPNAAYKHAPVESPALAEMMKTPAAGAVGKKASRRSKSVPASSKSTKSMHLGRMLQTPNAAYKHAPVESPALAEMMKTPAAARQPTRRSRRSTAAVESPHLETVMRTPNAVYKNAPVESPALAQMMKTPAAAKLPTRRTRRSTAAVESPHLETVMRTPNAVYKHAPVESPALAEMMKTPAAAKQPTRRTRRSTAAVESPHLETVMRTPNAVYKNAPVESPALAEMMKTPAQAVASSRKRSASTLSLLDDALRSAKRVRLTDIAQRVSIKRVSIKDSPPRVIATAAVSSPAATTSAQPTPLRRRTSRGDTPFPGAASGATRRSSVNLAGIADMLATPALRRLAPARLVASPPIAVLRHVFATAAEPMSPDPVAMTAAFASPAPRKAKRPRRTVTFDLPVEQEAIAVDTVSKQPVAEPAQEAAPSAAAIDPSKLKVVELRVELRKLGLDTKGLKAVLVKRLTAALSGDSTAPDVEEEVAPAAPRRRASRAAAAPATTTRATRRRTTSTTAAASVDVTDDAPARVRSTRRRRTTAAAAASEEEAPPAKRPRRATSRTRRATAAVAEDEEEGPVTKRPRRAASTTRRAAPSSPVQPLRRSSRRRT